MSKAKQNTHAEADSSPRCAVSPGSVTYALFKHMADEHGLTLLESELTEIVRLVNDTLDERLRWWITNAEGIAEERGALFRAGENMAAELCQWCPHEMRGDVLRAWDAAAQPIRDMKAALSSPNTKVSERRGQNTHE
jgi:hypothetical protein